MNSMSPTIRSVYGISKHASGRYCLEVGLHKRGYKPPHRADSESIRVGIYTHLSTKQSELFLFMVVLS